ncbi:MAG: ABC transporter substrate-binding protein [Actinomycetota bacterium]
MARHRFFLVMLLVILVAAACTNDPGTDEPARAQGGSETETAPYEHLARANEGEFEGTSVDIMGQWVDAEQENFETTLQPFVDATGIEVNYEGVTDYETVLNVRVEGGDAPDVAQLAQPGLMRSFQEQGALVNLSEWINVEQLQKDYIESFLDLASVDGDVYGVYFKADLKSIVWYPVQAFEENGYQVPATWDELMALSEQIVADGNGSPWCISMEHGDATGWVATDWIEDVLLRTAPVEVYDQWVAHEIPFNHPDVLEAAAIVEGIWFNPDFVFGGNTAINNTFVGDSQNPMFADGGPKCWMHKQAAWIPDFWPKDPATEEPLFEPGVDSSFFYMPPIEEEYGRPVLGGGDMFVMFDDRPEVRALMEFLATPEAAEGWIEAGGFVSPNQAVSPELYSSYPSSGLADILTESTALRFDASDTMPAEVGQGTFWSGMVDWVSAGGDNTEQVFDDIEKSWPEG